MRYALNLSENNRILSATYEEFAWEDAVFVDSLPEGNIYEYCYVDGEFVHNPLPVEEVVEHTAQDDTDAMLVDHEYRLTLLELFSDMTV